MEEAEKGVRKGSATRAIANGVRKLSPSPTRSAGPEHRKPSGVPTWLILDRIVHRSSRRRCREGD
jgi:hypothetical protein